MYFALRVFKSFQEKAGVFERFLRAAFIFLKKQLTGYNFYSMIYKQAEATRFSPVSNCAAHGFL